jgi:hypothetical protein
MTDNTQPPRWVTCWREYADGSVLEWMGMEPLCTVGKSNSDVIKHFAAAGYWCAVRRM